MYMGLKLGPNLCNFTHDKKIWTHVKFRFHLEVFQIIEHMGLKLQSQFESHVNSAWDQNFNPNFDPMYN
jgi:hypothetical protein